MQSVAVRLPADVWQQAPLIALDMPSFTGPRRSPAVPVSLTDLFLHDAYPGAPLTAEYTLCQTSHLSCNCPQRRTGTTTTRGGSARCLGMVRPNLSLNIASARPHRGHVCIWRLFRRQVALCFLRLLASTIRNDAPGRGENVFSSLLPCGPCPIGKAESQ